MSYVYTRDQELESMSLSWTEKVAGVNTPINLSTGYTLTVYVADAGDPATILVTKSTGLTGAATLPNYVIDWAIGDLSSLPTSRNYVVWAYARRNSDSKDRVFNPGKPPQFYLRPAPGDTAGSSGDAGGVIDGGAP